MNAKTDSDVTSTATSSPEPSRRPLYYVQSPSRESHDGEKATMSFHSTPMLESPLGSPPHSHLSLCRDSRESFTSRYSGSLKFGFRKVPLNDAGSGENKNRKERDMIEEEGLLDEEEKGNGFPISCYFLAFVVGFFVLFSLFALILWGASKPQKPKITMMSIEFERFVIQAGSDDTGVSTDMISVNSTVKFNYQNTAKFFRIRVASTPVALSYSQLKIGSGDIKEFYRERNRGKNVTVIVTGDKIPMYGSLSSPSGMITSPVQLRLDLDLRSRGYVLGTLLKSRFYNKIECSIIFDSKKLNVLISLKNSCTYDQ